MMVRAQEQASSQARARVWAPLGLLLVLACGAWFWRGAAWPGAASSPGGEAPTAGLIQPLPEATGTSPAAMDRAHQDVDPSGPAAAQVLEEVAQRGRQAPQAMPPASAPLSAEALQSRVRRDAAAVHRQTAGQRLRLQGTLASLEPGEAGVLVLHLALAGEEGTVRVVASPSLAQTAASWSPPRAVSLDCLSQGVMMGEWLLADCRE